MGLALHERVQAIRRLIEHEQVDIGDECQQQRQLPPVAGRKGAYRLLQIEPQALGEIPLR